jgi:hypothetical protein
LFGEKAGQANLRFRGNHETRWGGKLSNFAFSLLVFFGKNFLKNPYVRADYSRLLERRQPHYWNFLSRSGLLLKTFMVFCQNAHFAYSQLWITSQVVFCRLNLYGCYKAGWQA